MLWIALLAAGCASTAEDEPWQRVCYMQFMGKTDSGLLVARHLCVKPEQLQ